MSNHANMAFEYRIVARMASERSLARFAPYRDPLAVSSHAKVFTSPVISGTNRSIESRAVTMGRLPQRLETPFVPKPQNRH